jgi:PTS system cellobiose-specific IIB component
MRIHIVCGAGASSTFVALRVRRSAAGRGLSALVTAGNESDLADRLDAIDVVLVGPHLAGGFAAIEAGALRHGAAARLLPDTVFAARNGEDALDLAIDAAAARA